LRARIVVVDDATLIDAGRLSGLLKTLSKFTQWYAVPGGARWGLGSLLIVKRHSASARHPSAT
jgi:hypothetical protein